MREVAMLLVALACCRGAAAQDPPVSFTGLYAGVGVGSTAPTEYGGDDEDGSSIDTFLLDAQYRFGRPD
jgi:hypothetical protein